MKPYNIIVRSHETTILLAVLLMAIFFLIAGFGFPHMIFAMRIGVSIIFGVLAHFSIRRLATAKTEWTLSEQGISIKWLTTYFGTKSHDIEIKWLEINKYKDVSGRGYDLFKIYLFNGHTLKFGHGGLFIRDDFNEFYEKFQELNLKVKYPNDWEKYYGKRWKSSV